MLVPPEYKKAVCKSSLGAGLRKTGREQRAAGFVVPIAGNAEFVCRCPDAERERERSTCCVVS